MDCHWILITIIEGQRYFNQHEEISFQVLFQNTFRSYVWYHQLYVTSSLFSLVFAVGISAGMVPPASREGTTHSKRRKRGVKVWAICCGYLLL